MNPWHVDCPTFVCFLYKITSLRMCFVIFELFELSRLSVFNVCQHWPADRDQVATLRNGKTVLPAMPGYFSRSVTGVTPLPPKKKTFSLASLFKHLK